MLMDVTRRDDGDPLAQLRVADAMLSAPRLVRDTDSVELARGMLDERGNALMVVNAEGVLVGIVTRSDLRARPSAERERSMTLGDIAVRNVVTAQPNETLRAAARRMSRLGLRQLPVVAGEDPAVRPLLGLLRRSDILSAYERSLEETAPMRR
jgi:CIC family chloride channel protein